MIVNQFCDTVSVGLWCGLGGISFTKGNVFGFTAWRLTFSRASVSNFLLHHAKMMDQQFPSLELLVRISTPTLTWTCLKLDRWAELSQNYSHSNQQQTTHPCYQALKQFCHFSCIEYCQGDLSCNRNSHIKIEPLFCHQPVDLLIDTPFYRSKVQTHSWSYQQMCWVQNILYQHGKLMRKMEVLC